MSSFMERLSKADQIFRIEILEFTWQSNNKTVTVRSGDKGKSLYARFTLRFFLAWPARVKNRKNASLLWQTKQIFHFLS